MSKIAQKRQQFLSRTGAYSTVPSAGGGNLLEYGIGQNEEISPDQRREILIASLRYLQGLHAKEKKGSLEYKRLGQEILKVGNQLSEVKKEAAVYKDYQDVSDFLVRMFRERVTKAEWKILVAEANRRCDEQECVKAVHGIAHPYVGELAETED